MTEPAANAEQRGRASQGGQGRVRSLLESPALSLSRGLLALILIALAVAVGQIVDAAGGGWLLRGVLTGTCVSAAGLVFAGYPKRR